MAEAYKCDRCKKFFDGKPDATVIVRPEDGGVPKFCKAVCAVCQAEVQAFTEGSVRLDTEVVFSVLKNCGVDTDCNTCMTMAMTGHYLKTPHTCNSRNGTRPVLGPATRAEAADLSLPEVKCG